MWGSGRALPPGGFKALLDGHHEERHQKESRGAVYGRAGFLAEEEEKVGTDMRALATRERKEGEDAGQCG
jgi:hypothetical protein